MFPQDCYRNYSKSVGKIWYQYKIIGNGVYTGPKPATDKDRCKRTKKESVEKRHFHMIVVRNPNQSVTYGTQKKKKNGRFLRAIADNS